MHIDSRSLPAQTLHTHLCIVGAGPAGIALAREFKDLALEVALLESGGFEPDPVMQSLADGETAGDIKASADVSRRQFGGNANVWGVNVDEGEVGLRHALLDEIDFEARDAIPNSGWPFPREHLMPFYRRAQAVCQAGPFDYTPQGWERPQCERWPLDPDVLQTGIFRFSRAGTFTEQYRSELLASRNITLYTHATMVELITGDDGGAVVRARIARPEGPDLFVAAKRFVLACGGFENARVMLISNRQQPAGLGNAHDVVGRYYHDHPQGRSGYLRLRDPQLLERSRLYDLRVVDGVAAMGYLKIAQPLLRSEGLPNINCFLFPKPGPRQDAAIQSFNLLRTKKLRALKQRGRPTVHPRRSLLGHGLQVVRGLDYVGRMAYLSWAGRQASEYGLGHAGWWKLDRLPERFERIEVWHSIEQSPDPHNRVTLGSGTDRFGCPRLKLEWQWTAQDIRGILRAQRLIAGELERAGLGTLELEHDPEGLPNIERPVGSHHLMGTTRMHNDPRFGVVDENCRVHGVRNLFVAGSSIFPTGGYANPTLTLVALALALRLADRLKQDSAALQ